VPSALRREGADYFVTLEKMGTGLFFRFYAVEIVKIDLSPFFYETAAHSY